MSEEHTNILINLINKKTKILEEENKELKEEIIKLNGSSNNEQIEYYLRLRSDLLYEIDRLKQNNFNIENKYKNENEQLKNKIEFLNKEIQNLNNNNKNLLTSIDKKETTISSIDNFQSTKLKFTENNQNENKNDHNFTFKTNNPDFFKNFNENYTLNTNFVNNEEKIKELKERVSNLENEITEKDFTISDQNEKIEELESKLESTSKKLNDEINSLKTKYLSILSSDETLDSHYKNLYENMNNNYKQKTEKQIYELNKKISNQENTIKFLQETNSKLTENYSADLLNKNNEILSYKNSFKNLESNYNLMFEDFTNHLKNSNEDINKLKTLYVTREKEFINITNYYINMVNEYSKPLNDFENIKNKLEETNIKLNENLTNYQNENLALNNELNNIKNEKVLEKMNQRIKLTEANQNYTNRMKNIFNYQNDILSKLNILEDFMIKMEKSLNLFNSIINDNNNLVEKNNKLETEIKIVQEKKIENENFELKEKIFNLQKENELFKNKIKNYEEQFKEIINLNDNNKIYDAENVNILLKNEIMRLNEEINVLNKTKETIVNFYQTNLQKLINQIKQLKKQNDDYLNAIEKFDDDLMNKKETIIDIWTLEFEEFKQNLININEIKNIINNFTVQSNELKKDKDYIHNQELILIRQEIQTKDDFYQKIKKRYDDEKLSNKKIIENFQKNLNDRLNAYNLLIDNKNKEIQALKMEKEKLESFNNTKKEMNEKELIIWNNQKNNLDNIFKDYPNLKDKEIDELKNNIILLEDSLNKKDIEIQKKLKTAEENFDEQIKLIKDREIYINNLYDILKEEFDIYKDEKEKVIKITKMELEQLKDKNILLLKKFN